MTEDKTKYGLDNEGRLVAKNRAWRRRQRTIAELDGKPKSYYTTKQTKKRRRNGKTTKVRKKSR